jgi:hypothetical protein
VERRLDGHARWSAGREELAQRRGAAWGQVCTAAVPAEAGADKDRARARAVVVVGRDALGGPLSRRAGEQALGGVPVSDAPQGEQSERGADGGSPVLAQLQTLAAQGEVIAQDDTQGRMVALRSATRHAPAAGTPAERPGMSTTGVVVQQDEPPIGLSLAGRAHAGENLGALVALREPGRDKPRGMSEALGRHAADAAARMRWPCLAQGRRTCRAWEETFPEACPLVLDALKQGCDPDEAARLQQRNPAERLASHQHASGPIMEALPHGREPQCEERHVEPNRRCGHAWASLLPHGQTRTRL